MNWCGQYGNRGKGQFSSGCLTQTKPSAVLCCVPLASHKAKVSGRERQRKMCIREKETAGMPAGSQRVAQGWGMCETERVSR